MLLIIRHKERQNHCELLVFLVVDSFNAQDFIVMRYWIISGFSMDYYFLRGSFRGNFNFTTFSYSILNLLLKRFLLFLSWNFIYRLIKISIRVLLSLQFELYCFLCFLFFIKLFYFLFTLKVLVVSDLKASFFTATQFFGYFFYWYLIQ